MNTLQMLHPIVFASEAFGMPFTSKHWAEEFLLAVNGPLVSF